MSSKTGGPAFPVPDSEYQIQDTGMTLLDYFAGVVLQGFIANKDRPTTFNPEDDAQYCYAVATAMIEEKHKREEKDKFNG